MYLLYSIIINNQYSKLIFLFSIHLVLKSQTGDLGERDGNKIGAKFPHVLS